MSRWADPDVKYAVRTLDEFNEVAYSEISYQAYDALVSEGGFRIDQPVPLYEGVPDLNDFDKARRHSRAESAAGGVPFLLLDSQERSLLRGAYLLEAAARAVRCIVDRVDQPSLLTEVTRLAREAGMIIDDHQEIIAYDRPMTEADRQAIRATAITVYPDARWILESTI